MVGGVYLNNKPLCSSVGVSIHDSGADPGVQYEHQFFMYMSRYPLSILSFSFHDLQVGGVAN